MIDRAAYLARIGYSGPTEPTVETLAALSRAHLLTVPFENLDIMLGREIRLDGASVYAKVVERRRGGFCYELNGLFVRLLRDLGYGVDLLAMQFAAADGYGPERDHLTLLVRIPDDGTRWLADVGAGRHSLVTPIALDTPSVQPHPHDGATHRVEAGSGEYWHLWRQEINAEWQELYRFTLRPHDWQDFAAMCQHQQSSPESPFTQRRWSTKLTPDGRMTLLDDLLTITDPVHAQRTEERLPDEAAVDAVLRQRFGIALDAATNNTSQKGMPDDIA